MIIRPLKIADAENLLTYFRELVRKDPERVERIEDADKLSVKDEASWIEKCLEAEKKQSLYVRCSEVEGKIIAVGEIERKSRWIEQHVAEIRFGVLPEYKQHARSLVEELEEIARKNSIEVLIYFHLATQKTGLAIMKKAGFTLAGKIQAYYKRGKEYVDRVYLEKII
ncbi:GNAT family N-acetyltransferase [Candidatus Woesearchaeota archaeon]|nr:GNAT family N-acetyltransferase [Candidatus Woesearchaeota archaeon]